MNDLIAWYRKHSYQVHVCALCMMAAASALMYLAANWGSVIWIWALLGLFILGNLMELIIQ